LDFAERYQCKPVLLRLSLAGNLWDQMEGAWLHKKNVLHFQNFYNYTFAGARICKPFKEPRNRFQAWRAGTTTIFDVPALQATYVGWRKLDSRGPRQFFYTLTLIRITKDEQGLAFFKGLLL
jgi:hypothetical protein